MTKRDQKEYNLTHKLSKLICALINTGLFLVIFDIDHGFLFFIANFTYFFGVNTIARLIEKVLHLKNRHEIL